MTQELKDSLERHLQTSLESGDEKQINEAMCAISLALMDCQMKTATRVKEERADIYELKRDIAVRFAEIGKENAKFQQTIEGKLDTIQDELRSMKDKGTGAMAVIKVILKLAALGGGSVGVAGIAKSLGFL